MRVQEHLILKDRFAERAVEVIFQPSIAPRVAWVVARSGGKAQLPMLKQEMRPAGKNRPS